MVKDVFQPADNSQSRAVHALLIATPTVAATRELVREHSRSLLLLCIALKESLVRQCKCYTKQNLKLVSSTKCYINLKLIKQIESHITTLTFMLASSKIVNNKVSSHLHNLLIISHVKKILYSSHTIINKDNHFVVISSLRTRFSYFKSAVYTLQCLSCNVHLQSV